MRGTWLSERSPGRPGSEFARQDLDLWAYPNNGVLDFSCPGKPTGDAFIETFIGRLRDECLSANWLMTLADSFEKQEVWRNYYNTDRLHDPFGVAQSTIGNKLSMPLQNPGSEPNALP